MKAYKLTPDAILVETDSAIYYIWTADCVIDQFDKNLNYQGVFYCDPKLIFEITKDLEEAQIKRIIKLYQKIDLYKEIKLEQYLTHQNQDTREMIKAFLNNESI